MHPEDDIKRWPRSARRALARSRANDMPQDPDLPRQLARRENWLDAWQMLKQKQSRPAGWPR